jgi:hypothetical protein
MPYRAQRTDHIGYSERLNALYDRLRAAGLPVESSRLDSYRQTFATNKLLISENRVAELQTQIPIPTFINDFHESNEILEACDQFPDLNVPGLYDRIRKALSGTKALEQETADGGGPRNFLFELVMASTIKAAGFHVHLDRDEDVYFEISGVPCFMECKRVQSQRKLGDRIGHAADQIRKRCDNSRDLRARGIVAVDVSKLLNAGTHLFDCATRGALSFEAERKLELFRVEHMSTLEAVHERCVLGVYVYARLPGAVRQPVGLWTARKAIFIMLHELRSESATLALNFFRQVEAWQSGVNDRETRPKTAN